MISGDSIKPCQKYIYEFDCNSISRHYNFSVFSAVYEHAFVQLEMVHLRPCMKEEIRILCILIKIHNFI